MGYKVKSNLDLVEAELTEKLSNLGIEIIIDDEDKNEDEKDKEKTDNK